MAIIISDQSMPYMTGVEFFIETKDSFPDTIRILLTGYGEEQINSDLDEIQQADIFKCATKPCSPQELSNVIQECLEVYKTKKGL